jgi:tRNA-dihydrouridine synthase B
LYGEFLGVRSARKHIGWYTRTLPGGEAFRVRMNLLDDCSAQISAVSGFFDELAVTGDRIPVPGDTMNPDNPHAFETEELAA